MVLEAAESQISLKSICTAKHSFLGELVLRGWLKVKLQGMGNDWDQERRSRLAAVASETPEF